MKEYKSTRLTKLPPEVEAQLPKEIQTVRAFYFSLSEEERAKLDNPKPAKEVNTEMPEYIKIMQKIQKEVEDEKKNGATQKSTKFCFECGKKISRSAKFCEECGIKQPTL
jgi:hypothetical protein